MGCRGPRGLQPTRRSASGRVLLEQAQSLPPRRDDDDYITATLFSMEIPALGRQASQQVAVIEEPSGDQMNDVVIALDDAVHAHEA